MSHRGHALVRAVSRLFATPALIFERCTGRARGPGVAKNLDAARKSIPIAFRITMVVKMVALPGLTL